MPKNKQADAGTYYNDNSPIRGNDLLDDISMHAILSPSPNLHRENEQLRQLLTWIAWMIHDTDANGKISERFCRLCKVARLKHQKCRHAEIFAFRKDNI